MFRTWSVYGKIAGGVIVSLVVILGVVFSIIIRKQGSDIYQQESASFERLSRAYVKALELVMKTGDPDDVRGFLRENILNRDGQQGSTALSVSVAGVDKKIVWDTDPRSIGAPLALNESEHLEERGGFFSLGQRILGDQSCVKCHQGKSGDLRGYFMLKKSTAEGESRIAANRKSLTIDALALVVLIGLVTVILVRFIIIQRLRRITEVMQAVARGDLSVQGLSDPASDEMGKMTAAFNLMLESVRKLVKQIGDTAVQLIASSTEFQASADQQERGAIEQSSAVEENRRTMDSLLESARQVAQAAQVVFQNAEKAQNNSRLAADRIAALSSHSQRIIEILQVIKDIANKSDILALNAALEGTKAGEAGRGFSLVASQLQRLAEHVMASVRDIKELTETITEATRSTVLTTEESTKFADDTTRSARQIVMHINQQQAGTEQVSRAMEDVAQVARQTAAGSKQVAAATRDLVQLAEKLRTIVSQFKTEDGQGLEASRSAEPPASRARAA
jgi:methyl-accepting chemotaxis protein